MKHLQSAQVWAYLDGELRRHEVDTIDDHLSGCTECQNKVDEIQRLWHTMGRVLKDDIPVTSPRFHADLLHALSENVALPMRHRETRQRRRAGLMWGLASAAAVVVAAGTGWYVLRGDNAARLMGTSVALGNTSSVSGGGTVGGQVGNTINPTNMGYSSEAPNQSINGIANGSSASGGVSLAVVAPATITGQANVTVQSPSGAPLRHAHVAFVANGRILDTAVTDANGVTKPVLLTLPTDKMLAPILTAQASSFLQGDMTVVVWKSGYRPVVSYDVRVFEGGTSEFTQTVSLPPLKGTGAAQPEVIGYGTQSGTTDYHLLSLDAFANWVRTASRSTTHPGAALSKGVSNTGMASSQGNGALPVQGSSAQVGGSVDVTVVDQNGHPVENAHVAVVAGSTISSSTLTGSGGRATPLPTRGVPDWRFVGPWNVANLSPRSAAVVVWKQGYAPAVGMYVPLSTANPTNVKVRLESLAWRQAAGYNNLDAPTSVTPERVPGETMAQNYVMWVTGQGY